MNPRIAISLVIVLLALPLSAGADHDEQFGFIAGTVTDSGGAPLHEICVTAAGTDDGWWDGQQTAEDGTYELAVPEGDYVVRFDDCRSPRRYIGEYFDDAQQESAATLVAVTPASTTQANAALALGGSVAGTVTTEGGDPIEGLCVSAEHDGDWASVLTGADGTYAVGGFATGAVVVRFGCDMPTWYGPIYADADGNELVTRSSPQAQDYVPEWYNDAPTFDDADPVPVVAGVATPQIDAALAFGGSISGVIETLGGEGLVEICASAYDAAGNHLRSALSTWSGAYRIGGLAAGDYRVEFSDCGGGWYAGEWFDDASGFTRATPVQVELGVERGSVHAQLARRPMPDLAVSAIDVRPVPVRTDAGTLPGTGTRRTVSVTIGNVGGARAWGAYLRVWVEIDNRHHHLGEAWLYDADPGEERKFEYAWEALGSVGDATVHACITPYQEDARHHNNEAFVHHYAVVGGLGVGHSVQPNDGWQWCGYESPY